MGTERCILRGGAALVLLFACSGCVTIKERWLFLDPIIAPEDEVTDARGEAPIPTTVRALAEETGGDTGVLWGAALEFAMGFHLERTEDQSILRQFEVREGTLYYDTRRDTFEAAGGDISALVIDKLWAGPRAPLVVYCGGTANTFETTAMMSAIKVLPFSGEVLFFDYPGYGRSPGARSVAGVEHAVATVAPIAAEAARPADRPLILWGYSLGGFACAEMARLVPADALILDSPVRNARAGTGFFLPRWLQPVVSPFVRFEAPLERFDIVTSLEGTGVPILVIGAEKDGVLPERGARDLYADLAAAGHEVAYVQAVGEGHFGARRGDEVFEAVARITGARRNAAFPLPTEEN